MVKVILGLKGSGKTKQMIQAINDAVRSDGGSVVCIEKGDALKYDVNYRCRLIDAGEYGLCGYAFLKGLICGLHAGNFDITKVFIDSFLKLVAEPSDKETEEFLAWCDAFGKQNNMDFCISISQDPAAAPEGVTKFQ